MEKIKLAGREGKIGPPEFDPDLEICINCKFVHYNGRTNEFHCWKGPPTPVGSFVQTPNGTQMVVGAIRPPTPPDEWCGEFKRKTSS